MQLATSNSDIQSQTIDWLRFPFILFVVFTHAAPNIFDISNINFSKFTGNDFNILLFGIIERIASICNSGFFIFSGYLFFWNVQQFNKNTYFAKLKSRLFTLVIPYFLWLLIGITASIPQKIAGAIIKGSAQKQTLSELFFELKDKGILSIFWDFSIWSETSKNILGQFTPRIGPYIVPLWFLQNLIVITLLSPIIYFLVIRLKAVAILIFGVLYLTGIWFVIPSPRISAIFFFTVGAYLGIHKKNLIIELRKYKIPLYLTTIATLIISLTIPILFDGKLGYTGYIDGVFNFSCTLSSMVIASYLIESGKVKANKQVSKSVFFVYASHTIIILPTVDIIYKTVTNHSEFWLVNTIRFPFVTVVTTLLCVFAYWFLNEFKLFRPIARVLSGNR